MELKYVGDLPIVSQHGVSFDHSHPDKYVYLKAAVELLEALSYGASEATQHLYNVKSQALNPDELLEKIHKYVPDLDEVYAKREREYEEFVDNLVDGVKNSTTLCKEDKEVYLANIDIMRDYFMQYITNKIVYEAAVAALADEVHVAKVQEIIVPMFKNYAVVLNDMANYFQTSKYSIEADMQIVQKDGELIGIMQLKHR